MQPIVKFQGSDENRIPLDTPTIDVIEEDGCHWAVGYPLNKRPVSVQKGDVVFISRLTHDPKDIYIYGCAIARAHRPGQDEATPADIKLRPWKKKWPLYLRLDKAEFVDGKMENGVSLYEMMDKLDSDSFVTTQEHAASGIGNTDPHLSVRQQAAARLSRDGFKWINRRLQAAFNKHGKIAQRILKQIV